MSQHEAVRANRVEILKTLIRRGGFNVNAKDTTRNKYTPLHVAVELHNQEACIALLQLGADTNITCVRARPASPR